jgi:hypothetical protein
MTLKSDLARYRESWGNVETLKREERRSASLELRWRQLNAAYALAIGLGLLVIDPSEAGVIEVWARLKTKATDQSLRT